MWYETLGSEGDNERYSDEGYIWSAYHAIELYALLETRFLIGFGSTVLIKYEIGLILYKFKKKEITNVIMTLHGKSPPSTHIIIIL